MCGAGEPCLKGRIDVRLETGLLTRASVERIILQHFEYDPERVWRVSFPGPIDPDDLRRIVSPDSARCRLVRQGHSPLERNRESRWRQRLCGVPHQGNHGLEEHTAPPNVP